MMVAVAAGVGRPVLAWAGAESLLSRGRSSDHDEHRRGDGGDEDVAQDFHVVWGELDV